MTQDQIEQQLQEWKETALNFSKLAMELNQQVEPALYLLIDNGDAFAAPRVGLGQFFEDEKFSKDRISYAIKKTVQHAIDEGENVIAVMFVCEAWTLRLDKEKDKHVEIPESLADHPDRQEVVNVTFETYTTQELYSALVTRDEKDVPKVEDFEKLDADSSEGRFVGFLPSKEEQTPIKN
jgi:hypothetical protein